MKRICTLVFLLAFAWMAKADRMTTLRDSILNNITGARLISSDTLDLRKFGANPDGKSDCRKAIAKAISKANAKGGGVVNFPKGEYLVKGPINLLSNVIPVGVILKMLVGGNLTWSEPFRIFVRHQRVVNAVLVCDNLCLWSS